MKIIIPMSGIGKRFVDVGYEFPKPLIIVEGKPIIQHVIEMFPGGSNSFIFICNKSHLATTDMEKVLLSLVPTAIIIPIDAHSKGPVHATQLAFPYIKDDEDVMISYCDYSMEFDFEGMITTVKENGYAGAVPSYTGFHPHLLKPGVYGGILRGENGCMLDYKEKHSFTEDKTKSHHSSGAYYFSNGKEFKKYADKLSDSDISINGEKYTSMMYYLYLRDNKNIYVPEVKTFMQWGTPQDLEEFESWSRVIHNELGFEKLVTYIPKCRETFVSVPYGKGSHEYKACFEYWKSYFLSNHHVKS